ncbi:hypothetical protein AB4865_06170 [Capnocytophaga sp. ARDL2]|uniref:hypothetical protein n=1 Tax=Capnocytophaga sp. ARDL2 TaxID=3238809 RepID=UPI0035562C3D
MQAFPTDSYGRNLLMTGAAFNFSYFGDGWIKSTNDNGTDTYTYDATITSQKEVDTFLPGKEYMGENFDLIGTHIRTNQKAYHYEFKGNKVYKNGKLLDLTNNHTTKGGSMVMNPEKRGGEFTEFSLGGAAGGGIGLAFGVVRDNFGESSFYFTFSGYAGLGGGLGINSGVISPTNNQTFSVNDFSGSGNSWSINVGFLSYERGGTQGNGFENYGIPTEQNRRAYIYNAGSQSGHYPSFQIKDVHPWFKGINVGGMITESKTWVY